MSSLSNESTDQVLAVARRLLAEGGSDSKSAAASAVEYLYGPEASALANSRDARIWSARGHALRAVGRHHDAADAYAIAIRIREEHELKEQTMRGFSRQRSKSLPSLATGVPEQRNEYPNHNHQSPVADGENAGYAPDAGSTPVLQRSPVAEDSSSAHKEVIKRLSGLRAAAINLFWGYAEKQPAMDTTTPSRLGDIRSTQESANQHDSRSTALVQVEHRSSLPCCSNLFITQLQELRRRAASIVGAVDGGRVIRGDRKTVDAGSFTEDKASVHPSKRDSDGSTADKDCGFGEESNFVDVLSRDAILGKTVGQYASKSGTTPSQSVNSGVYGPPCSVASHGVGKSGSGNASEPSISRRCLTEISPDLAPFGQNSQDTADACSNLKEPSYQVQKHRVETDMEGACAAIESTSESEDEDEGQGAEETCHANERKRSPASSGSGLRAACCAKVPGGRVSGGKFPVSEFMRKFRGRFRPRHGRRKYACVYSQKLSTASKVEVSSDLEGDVREHVTLPACEISPVSDKSIDQSEDRRHSNCTPGTRSAEIDMHSSQITNICAERTRQTVSGFDSPPARTAVHLNQTCSSMGSDFDRIPGTLAPQDRIFGCESSCAAVYREGCLAESECLALSPTILFSYDSESESTDKCFTTESCSTAETSDGAASSSSCSSRQSSFSSLNSESVTTCSCASNDSECSNSCHGSSLRLCSACGGATSDCGSCSSSSDEIFDGCTGCPCNTSPSGTGRSSDFTGNESSSDMMEQRRDTVRRDSWIEQNTVTEGEIDETMSVALGTGGTSGNATVCLEHTSSDGRSISQAYEASVSHTGDVIVLNPDLCSRPRVNDVPVNPDDIREGYNRLLREYSLYVASAAHLSPDLSDSETLTTDPLLIGNGGDEYRNYDDNIYDDDDDEDDDDVYDDDDDDGDGYDAGLEFMVDEELTNGSKTGLDKTSLENIAPRHAYECGKSINAIERCQCVVCREFLGDEAVRRLPCDGGHTFHVRCIDRWLDHHTTCPTCRTDFSTFKEFSDLHH